MIKGCIFDLDGVIVDTAKYHYQAWRRLAHVLNIDFSEEENENLKGVSRVESLEYILKLGNVEATESEKIKYAEAKNTWYIELISHMNPDELLPGSKRLLKELRKHHIKIALGSASKNAIPILKSTGVFELFDFISDGNSTSKSKPNPEVFLIAAEGLGFTPSECIVFEDAVSGIAAANAGGFFSFGIGDKLILKEANHVVPNLDNLHWNDIQKIISDSRA